jgi:hypothetical protein
MLEQSVRTPSGKGNPLHVDPVNAPPIEEKK